ncbi:MAG: hypothetical protein K8T91_01535 [Planctomycetes bacterium]|nr:hypothetical protein [Planctomycetota bacterium]
MLLSDDQLDRVAARCGWYIAAGAILIALPFFANAGWYNGFFLGITVLCYGVCCWKLRKWRSEPGLWMMAIFLVLFFTPLWAWGECAHGAELVERYWHGNRADPITWNEIMLSIEATVALMVYCRLLRVAVSIAVKNRRIDEPVPETAGKR